MTWDIWGPTAATGLSSVTARTQHTPPGHSGGRTHAHTGMDLTQCACALCHIHSLLCRPGLEELPPHNLRDHLIVQGHSRAAAKGDLPHKGQGTFPVTLCAYMWSSAHSRVLRLMRYTWASVSPHLSWMWACLRSMARLRSTSSSPTTSRWSSSRRDPSRPKMSCSTTQTQHSNRVSPTALSREFKLAVQTTVS